MKSPIVFGAVVGLHILAMGAFISMQGCATRPGVVRGGGPYGMGTGSGSGMGSGSSSASSAYGKSKSGAAYGAGARAGGTYGSVPAPVTRSSIATAEKIKMPPRSSAATAALPGAYKASAREMGGSSSSSAISSHSMSSGSMGASSISSVPAVEVGGATEVFGTQFGTGVGSLGDIAMTPVGGAYESVEVGGYEVGAVDAGFSGGTVVSQVGVHGSGAHSSGAWQGGGDMYVSENELGMYVESGGAVSAGGMVEGGGFGSAQPYDDGGSRVIGGGVNLSPGFVSRNTAPSAAVGAALGGSSSRVSAGSGSGTYVIQKGDNLSRIAKQFGVSVNQLRAWNNMKGSRIYPGKTLVVSGGSTGSSSWKAPTVAPKNTSKPKKSAGPLSRSGGSGSSGRVNRPVHQPGYTGKTYTVRSGDTLSEIAHRNGIKTRELKKANGLNSDRINVGWKLMLPGVSGGNTKNSTAGSGGGGSSSRTVDGFRVVETVPVGPPEPLDILETLPAPVLPAPEPSVLDPIDVEPVERSIPGPSSSPGLLESFDPSGGSFLTPGLLDSGPSVLPVESPGTTRTTIPSTPPDRTGAFPYNVTEGDTLEELAKGYLTTKDEIIRLNPELSSGILTPGKRIWIPPLD